MPAFKYDCFHDTYASETDGPTGKKDTTDQILAKLRATSMLIET